MGKQKVPKSVSRRDVLKLAGTAAAFCTSFGFLHGGEGAGQLPSQQSHKLEANSPLQMKWKQAEMKWYSGTELLGSSEFPSKVLKHLQSSEMASVEIKWYRTGRLQQSLGKIAANR
ncbi:MAG: hypothetical protein MUQ25_10390 [Candidatus Aminicenantes bacterium]|nr:hypothetical protein [Candidatus Aminicenantes bacterium]MCJ7486557.1 hypothetical protein [Candidatus Aminicenantes bacterium]